MLPMCELVCNTLGSLKPQYKVLRSQNYQDGDASRCSQERISRISPENLSEGRLELTVAVEQGVLAGHSHARHPSS